MRKIFFSHKYIGKTWPLSTQRCIPSAPNLFSHGVRHVVHFEGNFREAIWPIIMVGQLFGVMPVAGIKSRPISKLHFNWRNWRTVHSLLVLGISSAYTVTLAWNTFSSQVQFSSIAFLLFYASTTGGLICFFKLSLKWPALMRHWEAAETKLPTFRNQRHRRYYIIKLRSYAFVILGMALVEHMLSIASILHFTIVCQKNNDPLSELLETQSPYLLPSGSQIFDLIFGQFINFSATFVWNFVDVFVIMISIGLSTIFKLYNEDLERVNGVNKLRDYWMHRRLQYGLLRDLVTTVDRHVTGCTLISFTFDLLFICRQIFRAFRPMPTYVRMIYFWFSIILLIFRAVFVSLSAAHIHDGSLEVIKFLYAVPSHLWSTETKRFLDEVNRSTVALSGMNFFYFTRKLILSAAGTILTYELVLMQFQSTTAPDKLCDTDLNKAP